MMIETIDQQRFHSAIQRFHILKMWNSSAANLINNFCGNTREVNEVAVFFAYRLRPYFARACGIYKKSLPEILRVGAIKLMPIITFRRKNIMETNKLQRKITGFGMMLSMIFGFRAGAGLQRRLARRLKRGARQKKEKSIRRGKIQKSDERL